MNEDLNFKVMIEADKEAVKVFLLKHFFPSEPLNAQRRTPLRTPLRANHEVTCYVLQSIVDDSVDSGVAILAIVKKTEEIVGTRLCGIMRKDFQGSFKLPEGVNDRETDFWKKDFAFINKVREGLDMFKIYAVDSYLHFMGFAVRSDYRRRGIATRMVQLCIDMTRMSGIKLIMAESTSNYSRRIFENCQFITLREMPFSNFFGKINTGEHMCITLHVKKL